MWQSKPYANGCGIPNVLFGNELSVSAERTTGKGFAPFQTKLSLLNID